MIKKNLKRKVEEFFKKMNVKGEIEITKQDNAKTINLETEESSLLIGHHGQTLKAIGRLLRLVLGEEGRGVVLDINNYQQGKTSHLERMAQDLALKAKKSNRPQVLPYMSAYERRLIHMALKDRTDVSAESEGEEPRRRIVIKPKK